MTSEEFGQETADDPPTNPPPGSGMSQEEYDDLNPAERELVWVMKETWGDLALAKFLQMRNIRAEAETWAAQQTQIGAHNGPQDALRHAFWQCKMTEAFGAQLAKAWGDAHEKYSVYPNEVRMDLLNNALGRRAYAPGASCEDRVLQVFNAGGLALAPIEPPISLTPGGTVPPRPPLEQ